MAFAAAPSLPSSAALPVRRAGEGGRALAAGLEEELARAQAAIVAGQLAPLELISLADRLLAAQRCAEVAALYECWLAHAASPIDHVVEFNLGFALTQLGRLADAEAAYRRAIAREPGFAQARFNLATTAERLGRSAEAIATWEAMLAERVVTPEATRELYVLTCNNAGRALEQARELERAEALLRESLRVDPQQPHAIQHFVHLRQKQCAWPVFEALPGLSHADLVRGTSPLALLSASDDPGLQLAAAQRFVRERVNQRVPALAPAGGYAHAKLRIGFLSSDFCLHAVSLLTVELLELLDRSRFEVHGFCWSRDDGSALRARVLRAFDRYVPIGALDDAGAAQAIRQSEIDVLIDLQGLTSGARPGILAFRPAPVQMTYLGFPGTTALPCVDYVIADRFLIPDEETPLFSEAPLYLPHAFQCSDRQRPVGARPTRAACGLPDDAFVFCSFNNTYKLGEDVFAAWLRILERAPGSVLWLLADNRWAEANLRARIAASALDPARVIFAGRAAPPDYLARYQVADLFLDSYPFGGGTTANDALWMGLPLLTRTGRTFASRMAGSLLSGLGLPELITTSPGEYEARAVEIASKPRLAASLKARLAAARERSPVFDMPGFVRGFEAAIAAKAKRAG